MFTSASFLDALCITECNQQPQFGSVLPPSSVFDNTAIVSVLINLAVVSEESIHRFRNSLLCRSSARVVFRRALTPALLVELPNQCGESAVSELAACGSEGLADPPALMQAIDMKRTVALVQSAFSPSWPEKLTAS